MDHYRFGSLPSSLYDVDHLVLNTKLIQDYSDVLREINRFEEACNNAHGSATGGATQEEAYAAFSMRFCASACRTSYLLLDNNQRLSLVAQPLLARLAEGRIAILDAPCGSGAGILGLLSLVASLRKAGLLPRQRLEVSVVAGDFSPDALVLYEKMMRRAKDWLEIEGISINWRTVEWNARDSFSTTVLLDKWFEFADGCEDYVVLVAAFSAAAANNYKKYHPTFERMAERVHNKSSMFVWIEPDMNDANKFLGQIENYFNSIVGRFTGTTRMSDNFFWRHPLNENSCPGRVTVIQYRAQKDV